MKKFEDNIKRNRNLLDVEEPDDVFIWTGINKELDRRRNSKYTLLKIAAVIIVLVSVATILFLNDRSQQQKEMITLSDLSPDLKAEETIFLLTIDNRMDKIHQADINRGEYQTFFEEIEILDKYYQEYLSDLQKMGNNPRLIQAMLHYYELKIRILEKMLNEIEKRKNHENKRKI